GGGAAAGGPGCLGRGGAGFPLTGQWVDNRGGTASPVAAMPSRNLPMRVSAACASASRRGRPRKPHVPLIVWTRRKMLSRIFALLGSCSKRTSSTSTTSRLSFVSVRNSRSKSSIDWTSTCSYAQTGKTPARRIFAAQSVGKPFKIGCLRGGKRADPLAAGAGLQRVQFAGILPWSGGRDDDPLAFRHKVHGKPAGARQQPRVERLDGVGIHRMPGRLAGEQSRDRRRDAGVLPGRADAKAHGLPFTHRIDFQRPAARDRLSGEEEEVEQQF